MDEFKLIAGIIEKGGPTAIAAIMALMWWLERKDRKSAQDKMEAILERVVKAMEGTASAFREFRLLWGRKDRDDDV